MNALKTLSAAALIMAAALSAGGCRERKNVVYYHPADVTLYERSLPTDTTPAELATAPAHYGPSAPPVVYYPQPAPVIRYYTTPYPVYISRYRSYYGRSAIRSYYHGGNRGIHIGGYGRYRRYGHHGRHSGRRTHTSHRTRR